MKYADWKITKNCDLLVKEFNVVSLEDPVVGQMKGVKDGRHLGQVTNQLQVKIAVVKDKIVDFKFSENKPREISK